MARTLDPTLAAAQDSATRHPLVEIISSPTAPDIPFDGLVLAGTASAEKEPCTLKHSIGSVATVYVSGADLKYTRTDAAGQEFETTTIALDATIMGVSICELTGGNIGLTYFVNDGVGNYRLKRRIITPDGVAVSDGEIAAWVSSISTSHTWTIAKGANDYLMVYAKASGSNYYIYKRTSADFVTWSAESALTIAGLTTTNRVDSPSLIRLDTGELWLWFDYVESVTATGEELRNIYYSKSGDGGATWGSAVKATAYAAYSDIGKHPVALQMGADSMRMAYTLEQSTLKCPASWYLRNISYYYPDNSLATLSGDGKVQKIDIGTWTVTKTWSTASVPALTPDKNLQELVLGQMRGGGQYVPVPDLNRVIDLVDIVSDTITHYYFADWPAHGTFKNVTWNGALAVTGNIRGTWVDEVNRRLYVLWFGQYAVRSYLHIGYLDLNDSGPNYTFQVVVSEYDTVDASSTNLSFFVDPTSDFVAVSNYDDYYASGWLRVWNLSTGALYRGYAGGSYPGYGTSGIVIVDGVLYAGLFKYRADYGEGDRRGLVRIDLASNAITYHRPSWATVDNYKIKDIVVGEAGELVMTSYGYGVARYDYVADTWPVLYNNTTTPGVDPDGLKQFTWLTYAREYQYIFTTTSDPSPGYWYGVILVPWEGTLKSARYHTGTFSGGAWSFADSGPLVQGRNEYDAVMAIDPADTSSLFAFWQTKAGDIKWDKDGSSINLSPYLLCDQDVATTRSVDGAFNRLEFALSHGHLFDPHNAASLLRDKIIKGRKLAVRWGESIGGVAYWEDAGTFYVTESRLAYERGKYTSVEVSAEDVRTLWSNANIVATDYYGDLPEAIISDLAQQFGGLASGDISLPTFTGRSMLYHQWIDTALDEIINQICERFGYFVRITPDNKLSARRISDTAAVDHTYSNTGTIIKFEPDDKYSDFTNQVTVVGTERSYIEVTYPEERVAQLNGTVTWAGCKKDFHIPYSQDETKTYINPRLVVLESVTSMGFKLAAISPEGLAFGIKDDISERISAIDPDDKWCTVYIEVSDLTPVLSATMVGLLISCFIPDMVVSVGGGATIRVGSLLTGIISMSAMSILAATANYQYEIWATPTCRIRRTVQGTADDTAHQQLIGRIVARRIEDPLSYSVNDCAAVAAQELLVARLQRQRVKISKIAHLQDEEGDTIQIPHPYTGAPLKLFVTDINRRFKKSSEPDGEGYLIDDIEGWVLS